MGVVGRIRYRGTVLLQGGLCCSVKSVTESRCESDRNGLIGEAVFSEPGCGLCVRMNEATGKCFPWLVPPSPLILGVCYGVTGMLA